MEPRLTFPLWNTPAPGASGAQETDIPTLAWYPADPAQNRGAAMIVIPGGGFRFLAAHEGPAYAEWLALNGISAFVVSYRLASNGYRLPVILQDCLRGIRTVRARAAEFGIDPKRIGIIGASAGGLITAYAVTHQDDGDSLSTDPIDTYSSHLALGVLCYPVITLANPRRKETAEFILGPEPAPADLWRYSAEKQVTPQTAPCFLFHTFEDEKVDVQQSLIFGGALRDAGVPFEMHIYQQGNHGVALGRKPDGNGHVDPGGSLHPWTAECIRWLRSHGF